MYYKRGDGDMTISVRLNEKDTELIKAYAKLNNISLHPQKSEQKHEICLFMEKKR